MSRYREEAPVFARTMPSGKVVFYYTYYDAKGVRRARSTGCDKKTLARRYALQLYKAGKLIPEKKAPTWAEFTAGWWDPETCQYLKRRQLHDPMMENTIAFHRNNFKNHLQGYFAKYRMNEITAEVIDDWFLDMSDKGLKPSTINLTFVTLQLMLAEAVRLKVITSNPSAGVKKLKQVETDRKILILPEVRRLFPVEWNTVWHSRTHYLINKLAACTGMRIGELRGLRAEHIHEDYIEVCGQYTRYGYQPSTKTKKERNIPIIRQMREELQTLINLNGEGYVFSEDGGEKPLSSTCIDLQFRKALARIGIDDAERKERNLTFHAWRHFCNTLMLAANITLGKVQAVTGHISKKSTERYTHFDPRQFTEVRNVQTTLLTEGGTAQV